jgi:hypothetical protein
VACDRGLWPALGVGAGFAEGRIRLKVFDKAEGEEVARAGGSGCVGRAAGSGPAVRACPARGKVFDASPWNAGGVMCA